MDKKPPRQIKTYSVTVEKDAEGFPLCRWCSVSIRTKSGKPDSRRTFCNDPNCLHQWLIRSRPGYAAKEVLKRDKGVCSGCGLDCVKLFNEMRLLRKSAAKVTYEERCNELGLPRHLRDMCRRLWEMDHEVPVAEGGGSCGLENLRTMCWACHKKVTAELVARLGLTRKKAA